MSFFFIYIIKLSVSLAVVFLFYHFVLQKLTFYNQNRWYLVGYTLLSFFIPFINISSVLEKNNWTTNEVVTWIPVIHTTTLTRLPENSPGGSDLLSTVILILAAGMVVMLGRLLLQLLSFQRMMKKALPVNTEGMNLYQVNENIIPFSFGNSIFINRHLHSEKELEEIIRHEFVHVKQRHSLDIIWAEILCLVNWFNPFAWLLKRSIRQNLEFIADHKVLENSINRKEYQYLLLKVIGNNQYSIATQFNFSSLKKRIAMMNKLKSAKANLLRFLFILPLLAVILLSFRNQLNETLIVRDRPAKTTSVFNNDTIPGTKSLNDKGYFIEFHKNKMKDNPLIIVRDKDKKEVKRLTIDEWNKQMDYYVNLYGNLPPPPQPPDAPTPPPPPPPPPPAPVDGVTPVVPAVPVTPASRVRSDQIISSTTPKAISNGDEIDLSRISSEYEITDKKAVIKLKNGTTEKYDLTNKHERSDFETKYGKIINMNTNVNTNANVNVNTNVNASVNVTPVAVSVNGKSISSTVTPVSVAGINNAITMIAPAKITKGVSAISVTPSAIRTAVSGTTVIAPMAATEGVTIIDDYGYTITGNEDILVTITKNTTRPQLEDFIKQMKAKDIELTYDNIDYNSKGQLIALSGTMKSKDGHSNFVASDFEKLILAMIRKGEKTWFKVSVQDKEVI